MNILIIILSLAFLFELIIGTLNILNLKKNINKLDEKTTYRYHLSKYYIMIASTLGKQIFFLLLILFLQNKLPVIQTFNIEDNLIGNLVLIGIIYTLFQFISSLFEAIDIFCIEAKFGFNKHTTSSFIKDQIIDYISSLFIVLLIGLLIYLLYTYAGVTFLLYGLVLVILLLILYHSVFVVIFLPMLFEVTPLEEGTLKQKIEAISMKENFLIKNIVVLNASKKSTKVNAYFSGFGKQKKIMLFDTLLDKFNDDEICAVVAHEIGHSKYKHMLKDLLVDILTASVYFGIFYYILRSSFVLDNTHPFVYALLICGISVQLIQKFLKGLKNYSSRAHEKQADLYVKDIKLDKELIHVLKVVSKVNKGNPHPHPLYVLFKYNHPSGKERIEYLT